LYDTQTSTFTKKKDISDGKEFVIVVDKDKHEMVAVIAKPLSDKKSYWLKYLHKGNANFTFPWYAWMIIGLVGFCVFMTFIIGFSVFSKKWRLYKAKMILMQ